MFITFSNGQKIEAVLYSQADSSVRVAVQGADDIEEFTCIRGQWVSENCELVKIEFAWQQQSATELVSEADCICSEKLASSLIDHLLSDAADEQIKVRASGAAWDQF